MLRHTNPITILARLGLGALVASLWVLASCGSSDDPPPPPDAPVATISFPATGGLTDGDMVTVRGTAQGTDGVGSLEVNGVSAETTDEFANWSAVVPLSAGTNTLTVRATSLNGAVNQNAASTSIRRADVLLADPVGVTFDPFLNTALVVDQALAAVIEIDWSTGARTVFSGQGAGSGPGFATPRGIVRANGFDFTFLADPGVPAVFDVEGDGERVVLSGTPPKPFAPDDVSLGFANLEFFASDAESAVIWSIDPRDGLRRVFSGDDTGSGPAFEIPSGVTIDTLSFRLLVADVGATALYGVSLTTAARVVISGAGQGGGINFVEPREVTFDGFTNRAYVADSASSRRSVIAVSASNGERSTLSGSSNGTGPAFLRPADLSFGGGTNTLAVVDSALDALIDVNPQSGNRTVISQGYIGSGLHLDVARGVALEGTSGNLLVADPGLAQLWRITLSSGDRAQVSGPGEGGGTDFVAPVDVVVVSENQALVVDAGALSVVSVDLSNGSRSVFSGDGIGGGPAFLEPVAIDLLPGASSATVTDASGAVYAVALSTGDRTELAGPNVGSGPELERPVATTSDPSGTYLVVVDADANALISVDVASGERAFLSVSGNGPGIGGAPFADVIYVAADNQAIVADPPTRSLIAVNLANGQRVQLSTPTGSNGPTFVAPASLVQDDAGNLLTSDAVRSALLSVDRPSGDRVLRSK